MLAKVINIAAGKNVGFGPAVKYVFRDGEAGHEAAIEGGQMNLDCDISTEEDRAVAIELMNDNAKKAAKNGHFKGNPVYHFSVSWPEGEHPDGKQVHETVAHTLKNLGMGECQAVYGIHRDTDNDHVHIVVNRVHPEKEIVVGPPIRDFLTLDKSMREVELKQGWSHDNGPHIVTENTKGEKVIVRASKESRALARAEKPAGLSQEAVRAEKNTGAPSFQKWLRDEVAPDINRLIHKGGSWQDIHDVLAERGCTIERKGSGLILKGDLNGRVVTAKASQLSRDFKKMGEFEDRKAVLPVKADKTYAHFAKSHMATTAHDGPGMTGGKDAKREQRRAERAVAREALYDKFNAEKAGMKEDKRMMKGDMKRRHQTERSELFAELKEGKSAFFDSMKEKGINGQAAFGLWEREKIVRIAELKTQQQQERQSFSVQNPKGEVWRLWLEKEAAAGNEAARSALRGIHYREGSGKGNSISGEDLTPLKKEELKASLGALTATVNGHQSVIYSDADGRKRLTDEGQRILVHDKSDGALEAALQLADKKYGGEVYLTGSADFREEAARECARQGIRVADKDLQIVWNQEKYDKEMDEPGLGR